MQLKTLKPFTPHIPAVNPQYVEMNIHADVMRIIASNRFFPTYIFGGSGIGKTEAIRQACAEAKREFLRVQIGPETDRSSLIIKFALIAGDSVCVEGPVLAAMRNGSVLMLDELDRGTDDLMCLQGILEGNPVLIEETGEVVHPAPGFTVIATGNTGGRGDVSGKFIAANELDHAFLERFKVVYKMEPPGEAVEVQILMGYMKKFRGNGTALTDRDKAVVTSLCTWAKQIRATEENGDISFSVSTRRLTFIVEQYTIGDNIDAALRACLGVYDDESAASLKQMFKLIDPAEEQRKRDAKLAKAKSDAEFKQRAAAAKAAADKLANQNASTPQAVPASLPPVKGNGERIVVTGKWKVGDRNGVVKPHLKSSGFQVRDSISGTTDFLVTGGNPGQGKLDKAKKHGVTVLSEEKFFKKFKDNTAQKQAGSTFAAVSAAVAKAQNHHTNSISKKNSSISWSNDAGWWDKDTDLPF